MTFNLRENLLPDLVYVDTSMQSEKNSQQWENSLGLHREGGCIEIHRAGWAHQQLLKDMADLFLRTISHDLEKAEVISNFEKGKEDDLESSRLVSPLQSFTK